MKTFDSLNYSGVFRHGSEEHKTLLKGFLQIGETVVRLGTLKEGDYFTHIPNGHRVEHTVKEILEPGVTDRCTVITQTRNVLSSTDYVIVDEEQRAEPTSTPQSSSH